MRSILATIRQIVRCLSEVVLSAVRVNVSTLVTSADRSDADFRSCVSFKAVVGGISLPSPSLLTERWPPRHF
jgi:hypothetical protein